MTLVRTEIEGITLYAHPDGTCLGATCTIHKPTDHRMRSWTLHWRDDRGIFERICSHGVGHPDPDQFEYWRHVGAEWQSVHGCDGCCRPEASL